MRKLFNINYSVWHMVVIIFGIKMNFKYKPRHVDIVNIISDPRAGIGNRIFGIVNMLSYFKPTVLNIHWDTQNWVKCRLSDIFDIQTSTEIHEFESSEFAKKKIKKSLTVIGPSCALKTLDGRNISLKFNEISQSDIEYFNNIFQNIKPSEKVLERINGFNQKFDYVMQVRNNNDWEKFGRNEPLKKFFDEINKLPNDAKIYISAMNKRISDEFKNKYGDRIVELENKDYSSMIDAVADLYIMSKADSAIYSYGSTFGELAFWLGGAKQKVTVVGSEDNWL